MMVIMLKKWRVMQGDLQLCPVLKIKGELMVKKTIMIILLMCLLIITLTVVFARNRESSKIKLVEETIQEAQEINNNSSMGWNTSNLPDLQKKVPIILMMICPGQKGQVTVMSKAIILKYLKTQLTGV